MGTPTGERPRSRQEIELTLPEVDALAALPESRIVPQFRDPRVHPSPPVSWSVSSCRCGAAPCPAARPGVGSRSRCTCGRKASANSAPAPVTSILPEVFAASWRLRIKRTLVPVPSQVIDFTEHSDSAKKPMKIAPIHAADSENCLHFVDRDNIVRHHVANHTVRQECGDLRDNCTPVPHGVACDAALAGSVQSRRHHNRTS